jgi:hypothetical protein
MDGGSWPVLSMRAKVLLSRAMTLGKDRLQLSAGDHCDDQESAALGNGEGMGSG